MRDFYDSMSTSILIYDSNPRRQPALAAEFRRLGCNVIFFYNGALKDASGTVMTKKWHGDLAFVHTGDEPVNAGLVDLTAALTIFYSTAAVHGREFGIPREVSGKDPLPTEQCRAILELLAVEPSDRKKQFENIWSGVPELLLSWTLLEAYGEGNDGAQALKRTVREGADKELQERTTPNNKPVALTLDSAKAMIEGLRADV